MRTGLLAFLITIALVSAPATAAAGRSGLHTGLRNLVPVKWVMMCEVADYPGVDEDTVDCLYTRYCTRKPHGGLRCTRDYQHSVESGRRTA